MNASFKDRKITTLIGVFGEKRIVQVRGATLSENEEEE